MDKVVSQYLPSQIHRIPFPIPFNLEISNSLKEGMTKLRRDYRYAETLLQVLWSFLLLLYKSMSMSGPDNVF